MSEKGRNDKTPKMDVYVDDQGDIDRINGAVSAASDTDLRRTRSYVQRSCVSYAPKGSSHSA